MKLYHFTSEFHLPRILAAGFLMTTESNVGSPYPGHDPYGDHAAAPVVWLMDDPEGPFRYNHGLAGAAVDKKRIRFTVEVDAVRWLNWQPAMDMHPEWRKNFLAVSGGLISARRWYVSEESILQEDWLEILDMKTGAVL